MARLIKNQNGQTEIVDTWGEDDIQSVADCNFDLVLTPEQVGRVMEIVAEGNDANIGLNWDVIDNAIEIMLEEGEIA